MQHALQGEGGKKVATHSAHTKGNDQKLIQGGPRFP